MSNTVAFVREALVHYSEIGSPFPSSPYLARSMVEALGTIAGGEPVVELGPGTGAFTRVLLEKFPKNPILAVEWNPRFASLLRRKYPRLRVGVGCASTMDKFLEQEGIELGGVAGVLSGLPLLSLPQALREDIFKAVHRSLQPGGLYVQMTYSRVSWKRFRPKGLHLVHCRRVWRNFPPATVMAFVKD